jgi:hypothetical protein
MTIQKRVLILTALLALAFIIYGMTRYYSSELIHHIVEQSLIQKAPPGVDAQTASQRLEAIILAEPDKEARIRRLLRASEYLEKIQRLTPEEWDRPDELFLIR